MRFLRPVRLAAATAVFCVIGGLPLAGQTPAPPSPPQQPPTPAPAPAPSQPQRNPFENVPATQPTQQPETPKAPTPLQAPKPAPTLPAATGQLITAIEFRGSRRVPADSLRATIMTKVGDFYSPETLRRDFMKLWNGGRFDDLRLETEEDGKGGMVIRFIVQERRVVSTINYQGMHSLTISEVLDRFKERKVSMTVDSPFDPNKIQRAAVVIKDYLSERGRQYATVDPQLEQVPPSSLKLTFVINEGPKVKVGNITITGNKAEKADWIVAGMKLLKPVGIPHSILFERVFAKTYDQNKLEYDMEKVREKYTDNGYFRAKIFEPNVNIAPRGGKGWRLPLIKMNKPGIFADITIPVEEGRLYRLHNVNFVGVKAFKEPNTVLLPIFGMRLGDVFSTEKLRKGLENMRNLYGQFGYYDFVPEPDFDLTLGADQIGLIINTEENKQFFVRRIDFSGNTTTRDKVIRREIMLDEGEIFNTHLWDLSILRLNQLGYFEMLKKEDAADIKRNPGSDTVDITLKVKERGKNSIGLNGGVSGISGSFVGFNYSTNNFLGLGETLSITSQLGTRMRNVQLGFTEPYLFDRPIQTGFTVYLNRFNYNQARESSILSGQNYISLYQQLGTQNLLNYVQNSHGANLSMSYQLRRSFWRAGVTYGFDISNINTQTNAATNYFKYINFSGVSGPNTLDGVRSSSITPSLSYNTVNHPMTPTAGKSIFFSVAFAGTALGGNVNTVRPTVDVRYFRPSPLNRTHILAFHATGYIITGYGGKEIPPYSRSFIGGEQDVRGFENWGITPLAFIASSANVSVYNTDGTARTQKVISGGSLVSVPVTMQVPIYQLVTPGGDAQAVGNMEYRIPIFGPVTMAAFTDVGVNRILRSGQLRMVKTRVDELNQSFPQAGFDGKVYIASGTQQPRVSTGLELQVLLPVVNAPFRVYFAYNPSVVREYIKPPIVLDRSMFPNDATFQHAIGMYGQEYSYFEKRTLFRFTVGRTF